MGRDDFFIPATRTFALLVGIAFTMAGIAGFLPMFTQAPPTDAPHLHLETSYGLLLGLFPVNILHNLFHFGTGIFGLAAFRTYSLARLFSRFLGVTLALFTLMGIVPQLNTTFGLLPLYGHDIWLHGIEAVIGLYLGFFVGQATKDRGG
jgi:hypothetical protein